MYKRIKSLTFSLHLLLSDLTDFTYLYRVDLEILNISQISITRIFHLRKVDTFDELLDHNLERISSEVADITRELLM